LLWQANALVVVVWLGLCHCMNICVINHGTQVVLECKTWYTRRHLKGLCHMEGSFSYVQLVNKMRMELLGSFSMRIEDILSMKKCVWVIFVFGYIFTFLHGMNGFFCTHCSSVGSVDILIVSIPRLVKVFGFS
jgi:hypothetical protein